MDKLKPCLCGNFGDDGADSLCDRACECDVCGAYAPRGLHYRAGMFVCGKCFSADRWCPAVTIYPTLIQAWRDMTFSTGGDANDPEWHR